MLLKLGTYLLVVTLGALLGILSAELYWMANPPHPHFDDYHTLPAALLLQEALAHVAGQRAL